VLGHRPGPLLVGHPADEPAIFAVGAVHGWHHGRSSGRYLVENAHRAGHTLAGVDGFDVFETQDSATQRADRARYVPVQYWHQMHGAGGLAPVAGSVADQHHRQDRRFRKRQRSILGAGRGRGVAVGPLYSSEAQREITDGVRHL
jgi:hypothetical protein